MLYQIKMKALLVITTTLCPFVLLYLQVSSAWALSIDQHKPVSTNQYLEPKKSQYQLKTPEASVVGGEQQQRHDLRRPIWNMAHMVNSIKELDYRLGKGANSIEVDITFGRDGDPLYTYHGPPCDCWRHCHQQEYFKDYLGYLRQITVDEPDGIGKNLYLMLLDLKLDPLSMQGKAHAGTELAKLITTILFGDGDDGDLLGGSHDRGINKTAAIRSPLKVILSINHVTDVELVQHFLYYIEQNNATHLMERIGFDVGMNDDLQLIETMWKRFGNGLNLWQGDGYTNCLSPFYNLERLSRAIVKRDNPTGYPAKVYHWTIDLHDRMRESLVMGVDAIMTNHPERVLVVLNEPDFAHDYRLANQHDNPFKKIIFRSDARSSESARYQRSANSPTGGGFFGGLIDMISSWFTYIKEIPFLSLPTTSRFIPKIALKRHKQADANIINAKASKAEYRMNSASPTTNHNESFTASIPSSSSTTTTSSKDEQTSISDSTMTTTTTTKADITTTKEPPYQGPKWYTSLASNMLVSAMKIALPENRHNQTDKE